MMRDARPREKDVTARMRMTMLAKMRAQTEAITIVPKRSHNPTMMQSLVVEVGC